MVRQCIVTGDPAAIACQPDGPAAITPRRERKLITDHRDIEESSDPMDRYEPVDRRERRDGADSSCNARMASCSATASGLVEQGVQPPPRRPQSLRPAADRAPRIVHALHSVEDGP